MANQSGISFCFFCGHYGADSAIFGQPIDEFDSLREDVDHLKRNEALRPKSDTTDHGVNLPSDQGEPPDQFRKVAEVVLIHTVDLPKTNLAQAVDLLETMPEDATTGLIHAVDLPEAAATMTALAHAVNLPETMTQNVAALERVIAWPGSATHRKPKTGGVENRMKCRILKSPSRF